MCVHAVDKKINVLGYCFTQEMPACQPFLNYTQLFLKSLYVAAVFRGVSISDSTSAARRAACGMQPSPVHADSQFMPNQTAARLTVRTKQGADLVKEAKHVVLVDDILDQLYCRPGRGLVVALAKLQEGNLIHRLNLWDVALPAKGAPTTFNPRSEWDNC